MTDPARPLVSVVIAVFNGERYVGRAIRSVLAQTHPCLEILIVDDGSTDGTARVLRGFADPRIRCLGQPNRGQGAARNAGIRASTGRYITFLDADDVYLPDKVQRQAAVLDARSECGAVFGPALQTFARRPGRLYRRKLALQEDEVPRRLFHESIVNPNALMVRGDLLRGGLLFREDRYYPEEWDLCVRLARGGCRFAVLDQPLVIVETREDSNTAMTIQWTLKRHTLEMFERVFAEMGPEERAAYGVEEVLRVCRTKLAWAVLAAEDPAAAFQRAAPDLPPRLAAYVGAVVKLVPPSVLRLGVNRAWRFRQRVSLTPVQDPAVQRAWDRMRNDAA